MTSDHSGDIDSYAILFLRETNTHNSKHWQVGGNYWDMMNWTAQTSEGVGGLLVEDW